MDCTIRRLFFAMAVTLACSPVISQEVAREARKEIQWGVTFGFYAPTGYMGSDKAKEEIDAIAAAGALLRHVHIADYQTRMFPGFDKHETWRLKPFFAAASTASRGRT